MIIQREERLFLVSTKHISAGDEILTLRAQCCDKFDPVWNREAEKQVETMSKLLQRQLECCEALQRHNNALRADLQKEVYNIPNVSLACFAGLLRPFSSDLVNN